MRTAKSGFYFGIDHVGHIGLSVAVDGSWITAVSKERVPLLRWSHVAASFDPGSGPRVFINGSEMEEVWIGANQTLMGVTNTECEPSRKALANTRMVFDGLIDEIKLYNVPLSSAQASAQFAAVTPKEPQSLKYRVLPSGPKGTGRFGASYEPLKYAEQWDAEQAAGSDLKLTLDASADAPVVNPALVIENWGESEAQLLLNGKTIPRGPDSGWPESQA